MKEGYASVKDGMGDMAEGAEKMTKDTVHTIADTMN